MRLKYFDNYLMGVMSLVAFVCIYVLYGPKIDSKFKTGDVELARISDQFNTVKRKRDFYQSWADANRGDSLVNNDEIYTHEQSTAIIHFKNGQNIELSENSLLKIKNNEQRESLQLEKGSLTVELGGKKNNVDIVLGGKTYQLNSENAKIQIEQNLNEKKFVVLEGSAELNNNNSKIQIDQKKMIVENSKSGKLEVKNLPFALITPTNKDLFYFKDKKEIIFNWKQFSSNQTVKFVLSHDRNFKKVIEEKINPDLNFNFTLQESGTYFWKLTSVDEFQNEVSGPIRQFTLIEEIPLQLNLNKNFFTKGQAKNRLELNWNNFGKSYLLSITSPSMRENLINLTQTHYEQNLDTVGKYLIKVKVSDHDRIDAQWSNIAEVNLEQVNAITLGTLTSQSIDKVLYGKKSYKQLISFKSNLVEDVIYYIKVIKPDGSELKLEQSSNNFFVNLAESGKYTWEVIAKTIDQKVVSQSLTGIINVKRPVMIKTTPDAGAIVELERPDQLVNFNWDQETNADYAFELSSDPDFIKIIRTENVSANHLATSINKVGKYYWRVKVKSSTGYDYSNPISVEIKPIPELSKPKIEQEIKVKIKYIEKQSLYKNIKKFLNLFIESANAAEKTAVAQWDVPKNSKVKSYIVEIYADQNLKEFIKKIESNSSHIEWINAKAGTYYWRVSYVDYWGRATEFSNLSVISAEPEAVPETKEIKVVQPTPPIALPKKEVKKELPKITKAHEEPKLIPPIKIVENKIEVKNNEYDYQISYSPNKINLDQTINNKKIAIDGTVLDSFGVDIIRHYHLYKFDSISSSFNFYRGRVFSSENFTNININFNLLNDQIFYEHGPSITIFKNTNYTINQNTVSSKNNLEGSAGWLIQTKINKFLLLGKLEFGTSLSYQAKLAYKFSSQYSIGTYYEGMSKTNFKQNSLGVNFSYTFSR